jgi:hypothetical protein
MHPGSTFTHFGHDVAHTVFTAFMAAHRRFATVSRVPLFAHARSRGGLALATATVGRRTRCLGTTVNNSEQQQITTWSVLGTLPCSEHSSFRLKMILVPLVLYDNNNNTTTTQQQHNNNDTTTAKTTYLHPLMGQSNNEQSSPDRPSEQKQTSSRHRPVPLQSFKHTSFSQAKPPRPGGQWQAPVEKCGCNTCTTCRTRGKGKKERRKEGKKERRKEGQRFNRSVPATRERGSNSIVTTTGVSQ